jgi:hypothetical protein
MRVWGRIYDRLNPDSWTWVPVETGANGFDDLVMVTALVQVLKLSLGESPFYGDYGIPGYQSVITQIYPDYYVALTQQRYALNFASLIITRRPPSAKTLKDDPTPIYDVRLVTNQGVHLTASTEYPT